MWVGWIEFDLLLGAVSSLKQKRALVRPLVADLRRTYQVSAAEVAHLDLHRRAGIAVALVSGERSHLVDVLDQAERFVAGRPEFELLSARRRVRTSQD